MSYDDYQDQSLESKNVLFNDVFNGEYEKHIKRKIRR